MGGGAEVEGVLPPSSKRRGGVVGAGGLLDHPRVGEGGDDRSRRWCRRRSAGAPRGSGWPARRALPPPRRLSRSRPRPRPRSPPAPSRASRSRRHRRAAAGGGEEQSAPGASRRSCPGIQTFFDGVTCHQNHIGRSLPTAVYPFLSHRGRAAPCSVLLGGFSSWVNLPCRMNKSALDLHGSAQIRLQFGEYHAVLNRIGHSVSAEKAMRDQRPPMARAFSVLAAAGNISLPPKTVASLKRQGVCRRLHAFSA